MYDEPTFVPGEAGSGFTDLFEQFCVTGSLKRALKETEVDEVAEAAQEAVNLARSLRREVQFRGMFDVRLASERPRKTEPEGHNAAAARLADRLRDHVTMPADLCDPEISCAEANSGNRLPPVSCAFKSGLWHAGETPVTRSMRKAAIDKASGVYEHPWDFELRAYGLSSHGCEMQDILSRCRVVAYKACDVYKEALGVCERRTVPRACWSIDRRALEYT